MPPHAWPGSGPAASVRPPATSPRLPARPHAGEVSLSELSFCGRPLEYDCCERDANPSRLLGGWALGSTMKIHAQPVLRLGLANFLRAFTTVLYRPRNLERAEGRRHLHAVLSPPKKNLHAGALDFLPFLFERNGQVNREKGQGSCTRCAVVSWSGHPLQKQR